MNSGRLKGFLTSFTSKSTVRELSLTPEQSERLQESQLDSVSDFSTIIVMAGLLNTLVIMLMFGGGPLGNLFSFWAISQCAVMGYIIVSRVRKANSDLQNDVEGRTKRYVRGATVIGFFWAVIPLMAFPVGDDVQFAATGIILTATMFGGVLLIGRIPDAAMGFVLPILCGTLAALQLQQDPRNGLLSVLTLVYGGVLYFGARLAYTQFARQKLSQEALEEQTQVIGLLLKDFEENASDTLWQTDIDGRFAAMPDLFGTSPQTQAENSNVGKSFIDTFKPDEASTLLSQHMRAQLPFKDVVVRSNNETKRWLSVTGKPVFEGGIFQGYRGVLSDVTQARETEERVMFMAHHDELTGLPNRNQFTTELNTLSKDKSDGVGDWFIVWLDLDRFKWINDTMGHDLGDRVLEAVAGRLLDYVSQQGIVARISGDEFAIVDHTEDYRTLQEYVENLLSALSEPYSIWGNKLNCRASAGVKVLPSGYFDVNKALKQADTALNDAKSRERGSWCLFDHRMEDQIRAEHQLEGDLQKAVENNEFRLFFQPIMSAETREVVACETLLRWEHPQRGLLTPDMFIQFAEENGLITRIGSWTIRNAIEKAATLHPSIRVAINVSPLQIHSDGLVPTVVNALAQSGVDPARIELEITESVMISDTEFTMERLLQLKEIGVRIVLDDFGTGFSSLSYLRQFPFDKLKIDRCFIEGVETDPDSQAITRATLSLARALKIRCTGEGVETPGQADFLQENGCDELQGFMFSRPQPLENLGHLIQFNSDADETANQDVVVPLADNDATKRRKARSKSTRSA
ncbi:MAG: EAL domain-containing protein [Pseudomonadota bacterium]